MSTNCIIESPVVTLESLREILNEMSLLERDIQQLQTKSGAKRVDKIVQASDKKQVGVRINGNHAELVVDENNETSVQLAKEISQRCSRRTILNTVKNRGYRKVKEEKLPNGSIRLVVEKWQ